MADELKAFQREDRYIVIKRKDLAALADKGELRLASLDGLMDLCADLPAREYVVIESDWPEYQAAWQMIEARVNGGAKVSQGGETVEVVGYGCAGQMEVLKHVPLTGGMKVSGRERDKYSIPLMTVAQHQRILDAATHPADQVADDLTMVKVPRELANIAALHLENSGYTETGKKLRALLAKSEGGSE